MAKLHADIDDLTTDAKIECATHPMDQAAQTKLASLQSLKEILDGGSVTDKDLLDIRNSILQQKAEKLRLQRPPPPLPAHIPAIPTPLSYPTPQPVHTSPPLSTPSFVNQTNLAELLQATSNRNQTPQPVYGNPYQPHSQTVSTPPIHHVQPSPSVVELPLLAQLRASGLLSATPTPPQSLTPTIPSSSVVNPHVNIAGEVQFSSASIKIPRSQTITTFLNTRPNQCMTCGRRFTSDDIGKEKKSRHLDWHFKTKARMSEAEHRTQNRSWYVDEREWIASKEYEDDAAPIDAVSIAMNGSTISGVKKTMQNYVRAPADPFLRNAPCPIDQETFKSEWSEELQDFIWKDAIQVGGRYYHASCYKEATRDRDKDAGGVTPMGAGTGRTGTPDSVLGKRKAEVGNHASDGRCS
jgi:pre-mRNA cleavage complex 2 protein Pcf11